jgi:uncharacterized Zn finger protein (UPF0148 family)
LCVWCPESGPPARVKPGETSCPGCRVRRRRIPRPLGGVDNGVDKASLIAARTRTHEDGRTRYHGQGKRGQQPSAQLNRQDLDFAESAFAAGRDGLGLLETPEVQALPRVQREDVKRAAAHQLDRATRHIDDVLERLGHFKERHGRRDGE